MQTEDAPELTPEFLEDLRRYTEYGWGPGITAALLNRWHPVALTNLDVIRLRAAPPLIPDPKLFQNI